LFEDEATMSPNEPTRVFARVIESGFNEGKLTELGDLVSTDYVEHQFGGEPGLDGLKSLIQQMRTAFPDLRMTIEDSAVSGDKVWARLRCRGTHKGPLMGIPPTGKSIDTTALEVCRVKNGKLVEHWGVPDRFAAMTQLGLLGESRHR
jgi:predicted ester cyclase